MKLSTSPDIHVPANYPKQFQMESMGGFKGINAKDFNQANMKWTNSQRKLIVFMNITKSQIFI
jgi:hypothetical protein